MHIKLDAVGGCAGDMFVAALLHAFPDLTTQAAQAAAHLAEAQCEALPHNDGVLQGLRFVVIRDARHAAQPAATGASHAPADAGHRHRHGEHDHEHHDHDHHHHGSHHHGHGDADAAHTGAHRRWSTIEALLRDAAGLTPEARHHAIGIFAGLADAEATVHGIDVRDVTFHEVGAWDSIADIVAAATIVAELERAHGTVTWSVGPLPLGSGRVASAHGLLPIPAPATALLLQGFATLDDGIAGERVTPTGAAILRHLCQPAAGSVPTQNLGILGRSGIGFGTRRLPGLSNCLRALAFEEAGGTDARAAPDHRELAVIEFEVDDQSAEDLSIGLDRLRAHADVFDVVQMPVFGKKNRMMTHVRLLARASDCAGVIAACFRETTTIGLRHHTVAGAALPRRHTTVETEGRSMRVKVVERPGGRTAKAESDDVLAHETHARRATLRRAAERLALEDDGTS